MKTLTAPKEAREMEFDNAERIEVLQEYRHLLNNMQSIATYGREPHKIGRRKTTRNGGYDHTDYNQ